MGCSAGCGQVVGVEVVGDQGVCDVADGTGHVVVDAVPVGEPSPAGGAELIEGASRDQGECGFEVVDAVGAFAVCAGAQPLEEVSVYEEVLNEVETNTAGDGLGLTNLRIVASVRCAPPQNKPTTSEHDNCRPFLEEEMTLLPNTKVVISLGGFGYIEAARRMGISPRPKFTHGVEAQAPDGRILIGCYHVSQQNTFTGTLTPDMIDDVMIRAKELSRA